MDFHEIEKLREEKGSFLGLSENEAQEYIAHLMMNGSKGFSFPMAIFLAQTEGDPKRAATAHEIIATSIILPLIRIGFIGGSLESEMDMQGRSGSNDFVYPQSLSKSIEDSDLTASKIVETFQGATSDIEIECRGALGISFRSAYELLRETSSNEFKVDPAFQDASP